MRSRDQTIVATTSAGLVIATIAGRRWWQMGQHPTGLDGGQWLALGRGLVGDGVGRSTAGAYPPLVPFLTEFVRFLTDPSTALKLIAIGSLLAVLLAVYVVAREGLGPWLALAAVATIGPASALTEPTAFGGYPQQLAFAGLLLATWGTAHALDSGQSRWYLVAGSGLAGAALSHHIYFPLAIATCGLVWLLWLSTRPLPATALRRSLYLLVSVAISVVCFAPTAIAFLNAGYAPPLAAAGMSPWEAFQYGTREAVWPWLIIVLTGFVSLTLTPASRRGHTWQVAAALTAGCGALFAVTGEVRLLPPLLTGVVLGLGLGSTWLSQRIRQSRLTLLPVAAALLIPVLLWLPADAAASSYFTYYRILDESLLGAAAAIEAARPTGIVVVRGDWRNWPVGWWFEGLTTARIAVGSEPRWLGFPQELAQVNLVDRFFTERLTNDQVRTLASTTDVELLALKKWEWIGWQRWLEGPNPAVSIVYDDNQYLVLRIAR